MVHAFRLSATAAFGFFQLTGQCLCGVTAVKLCVTTIHAWIKYEHECPAEQPMSPEAQADYERFGCGLGAPYGNRALWVSQAPKVRFDPSGVSPEDMPSIMCHPNKHFDIEDVCARGIVTDVQRLYTGMGVGYFATNTLRLNPWRLSNRCKKPREHYIEQLKESGSRNCWGLAIDFKAMYCAFYKGIEAFKDSKGKKPICAHKECCAKAREQVEAELGSYMRGEKVGERRTGMFERWMPEAWQNLPPEARVRAAIEHDGDDEDEEESSEDEVEASPTTASSAVEVKSSTSKDEVQTNLTAESAAAEKQSSIWRVPHRRGFTVRSRGTLVAKP
eukprot:gnl/TRDRNA2_/TRDRNA2_151583_c0_seq1.p1 gnl/TRDRNA2_/TRDRNA2_151583_c0~~gnl/TRDRNA2_/TRDRNA2_151583_c0_seq1.p1  ORF type:complete len:332 (+),score=63.54 gnl/TRDRNA2_/TRDRNA2_151583_c0_seq1:98-1093(+)